MKGPSIERNVMVDRLVAHTVAAVSSDPDIDWLRFILKRGFIGYEHMSEIQLRNEFERCGLLEIAFDDEQDSPEATYDDDLIEALAGAEVGRAVWHDN